MRIGILLPSIYATRKYGEGRIFAPLGLAVSIADGLVDRGHTVRLYTAREVQSKAFVVSGDNTLVETDPHYYQFRYRDPLEERYTAFEILKRDFEYDLTMRAYADAKRGDIDVIHSFHDFGAHYFEDLTGIPTIYTIHDPLPQDARSLEFFRYTRFAHHAYVSISDSQRRSVVPMHFAATVYHGIDTKAYECETEPGQYLIHFGRIMEDKGTDTAIQVAKLSNLPIQIASSTIRGNRSQEYFEQHVAPYIDGTMVKLIGYLDGKKKSEYIKHAKAFVFPLKWEEPFGMVMIEAMACGTPVIAYNRGSVSEIVRDGVTGFIIDPPLADTRVINGNERKQKEGGWVIKKRGIEGMVEAVKRIGEIDRRACRKHVEDNFRVDQMVEGYERVYEMVTR